MSKPITINAVAIVAIILRALRLASDGYLQRHMASKHLKIPGGLPYCRNGCIGVPAAATVQYRQWITAAARRAGFAASVSTVTESTAAAMAYGLSFTTHCYTQQQQTILVFDMGGGTTDVTIAERRIILRNDDEDSRRSTDFQVVLTQGNNRLGGDDMDLSVRQIVVDKLKTEIMQQALFLLQ